MNKTKKITIISAISLVVLTLAIAVIFINLNKKSSGPDNPPNTTTVEIVWDGITATAPTGTGTKADPYIISSPENLAYMSTSLNFSSIRYKYYELTCNLDMGSHDWLPIGNSGVNMFTGYFEGNGYTIKNLGEDAKGYYDLKTAPSLFGNTKYAKIKNLNVQYSYEEAGSTYAYGGIVRENYGDTTLIACANLTDVITFNNCKTNYGYGGLIGYSYGYFKIETCYSLTMLKVNGTLGAVGGLVGRVDDFDANAEEKQEPLISDSYFAGQLVGTGSIKVGNIVGKGYNSNPSFSYCLIDNVYSVYDIESEEINTVENLMTNLSSAWQTSPYVNRGMPYIKQPI